MLCIQQIKLDSGEGIIVKFDNCFCFEIEEMQRVMSSFELELRVFFKIEKKIKGMKNIVMDIRDLSYQSLD